MDQGTVLERSQSEPTLCLPPPAQHGHWLTKDSYSLAYAEMRLIMAKMLWNFDWELADPKDDWMSRNRGYSVWYKGPLMIKLTQSTASALFHFVSIPRSFRESDRVARIFFP